MHSDKKNNLQRYTRFSLNIQKFDITLYCFAYYNLQILCGFNVTEYGPETIYNQ